MLLSRDCFKFELGDSEDSKPGREGTEGGQAGSVRPGINESESEEEHKVDSHLYLIYRYKYIYTLFTPGSHPGVNMCDPSAAQ